MYIDEKTEEAIAHAERYYTEFGYDSVDNEE